MSNISKDDLFWCFVACFIFGPPSWLLFAVMYFHFKGQQDRANAVPVAKDCDVKPGSNDIPMAADSDATEVTPNWEKMHTMRMPTRAELRGQT